MKNQRILENNLQTAVKQDVTISNKECIWHLRLGHTLPLTVVKGCIAECVLKSLAQVEACESCTKGKDRLQFSGSLTSVQTVERLHFDTESAVTVPSDDGHKFFFTVVEESWKSMCAL